MLFSNDEFEAQRGGNVNKVWFRLYSHHGHRDLKVNERKLSDASSEISDSARELWETLRRCSQNLAILASQRMLFSSIQPKLGFFYFIAMSQAPSELKLKKRSPWRIFRHSRLL